jgi:IS605 OrfB family transposase
MYAIKLQLKLNNAERTLMAQHAGFSRFVYNYGLALYKQVIDVQLGNKRQGIPTSNNSKKYFKKVPKLHARISYIQVDFLQKLTTNISRKYHRIRIEDLNIRGMMRHSQLADTVSNLGLYEFRRQLTYKQSMFGTVVELVDRWFPSSKMYSSCGQIQPMKLSDRVFHLKGCASVKCRDFNASLNLENATPLQVRAACDAPYVATAALSELNDCGEDGADSPRRSSK